MNEDTNSSKKINYLKKYFNLNHVGLADKLQMASQTLYNVKNNKFEKPSIEFLTKLESNLGVSKEWFLDETDTIPIDFKKNSETPLLWEDLKKQYEKRISELEFIANLFKAEKIADPRYANFLQPNTEKGRVLPHPAMVTGATCGVVANF
jgi:transcriptional regulator with XRE-family HTH domain